MAFIFSFLKKLKKLELSPQNIHSEPLPCIPFLVHRIKIKTFMGIWIFIKTEKLRNCIVLSKRSSLTAISLRNRGPQKVHIDSKWSWLFCLRYHSPVEGCVISILNVALCWVNTTTVHQTETSSSAATASVDVALERKIIISKHWGEKNRNGIQNSFLDISVCCHFDFCHRRR